MARTLDLTAWWSERKTDVSFEACQGRAGQNQMEGQRARRSAGQPWRSTLAVMSLEGGLPEVLAPRLPPCNAGARANNCRRSLASQFSTRQHEPRHRNGTSYDSTQPKPHPWGSSLPRGGLFPARQRPRAYTALSVPWIPRAMSPNPGVVWVRGLMACGGQNFASLQTPCHGCPERLLGGPRNALVKRCKQPPLIALRP